MSWVQRRIGSSIGLKFLMAVSGLGLLGFIVGHLAGNLLMYQGPEAMNAYAEGLKNLPYNLLYVARVGVIVLFSVHVLTAIKLQLRNKSARPVGYAHPATLQASLASRTMIHSGMLVLAYLLFHLAHFTWHQVTEVPTLADGSVDVYRMVVLGFQNPLISVTYIVAMIVLGFHLSHGISSFFQTVGFSHSKYNAAIRKGGGVLAWGLALGYITIPVSVWLGLVK